MGLDILPKGGNTFRPTSGLHNFKRQLGRMTFREGGEFGMLKNNQKSIVSAVAKRASAIKTYGGLTRMQRRDALLEIMKSDKNLTKEDKSKVKELLDYYARDKKTEAIAKAAAKGKEIGPDGKPAPFKAPLKVRINRDPNNQFDFGGLRNQVRPGVAARVNRAVSASQVPLNERNSHRISAVNPETGRHELEKPHPMVSTAQLKPEASISTTAIKPKMSPQPSLETPKPSAENNFRLSV